MILFLIILSISVIFILLFQKISKKINLFDFPDGIRKFQKNKVSCIGGVYFYFLFLISVIYSLIINKNFEYSLSLIQIENYKELTLFLFTITILFLIGIYDDKYEIKSSLKTLLLIIFISFYVYFEDKFQIKELRTIISDHNISLGNYSIFFTSICIFSLLVSFNMFDGSNGQSFINFLAIFIFLLHKGLFLEISYLIILMLFIFAFLNFKDKIYLGDNGVYFLTFLVAYLIISNYNYDSSIYAEEIVIILLIPILDMVRLFITRTFNGKNPFMGDATHIHHIVQTKYHKNKLPFIMIILIFFPLLFLLFTNVNYYLIITYQLLTYTYLVLRFKKI